MKRTITISVTAAALAFAGAAALRGQEITLSGQLRPRAEARITDARSDEFTTMRARVGMHAITLSATGVYVELQDVRLWGGELSTTANPDRIELHQGYVDLGTAKSTVSARIGRQEASYGEERLLGASDWTQQGRAFDGARARFGGNHLTIDGFVFQVGDAVEADRNVNDRFFGGYATIAATPLGALELYGLHNRVQGTLPTRQTTFGTRLSAQYGMLGYRLEAATQNGSRMGSDVHAFLGAARITATRGVGQITLWYDYLSGDDNAADGEMRAFDTLYGTNHKYYGTADLFTNIPLHTANRGLQDIAVKAAWTASKQVTLNGDLHAFRAAADKGLASADFGREADLNATYRYSPKLSVQGGASYYDRGEGIDAIHRILPSQGFTYIMITAGF